MRSAALEYKRRYLLALSEGKTSQQAIAEVAHDQSVKYRSVLKGLNRVGVKLKPAPVPVSADEERMIVRMVFAGWFGWQIAEATGRHPFTLAGILKRLRDRFPDLPHCRRDCMGRFRLAFNQSRKVRAA